VARNFGKEHFHVLRDIERIINCSDEKHQSNFGLVDYSDSKNEKRPMYELTRDAFSILVMGFTGAEAKQIGMSGKTASICHQDQRTEVNPYPNNHKNERHSVTRKPGREKYQYTTRTPGNFFAGIMMIALAWRSMPDGEIGLVVTIAGTSSRCSGTPRDGCRTPPRAWGLRSESCIQSILPGKVRGF
jgi:hypothetical protein